MRKIRTIGAALIMPLIICGTASAHNPIPTFDRENVMEDPYNRTGEQTVDVIERPEEGYRPGNLGTEEDPALYLTKINITSSHELPPSERVDKILAKYTSRKVYTKELPALTDELTDAYRGLGFTVSQAVIPPQEVKEGVLEVRVYMARYDSVQMVKNESKVADRVIERYLRILKPGETITDKYFERAVNNVNDLPGVRVRAILSPGSEPETTRVDFEAYRRPVWESNVFVDNGGGYYSGRYRVGFKSVWRNPTESGDKFIVSGVHTSHQMDSWALRYELPVFDDGTRWGVAYSGNSYELHPGGALYNEGKSRGLSWYGWTPIYRDRADRYTLVYGFDRRKITNKWKWVNNRHTALRQDKTGNVWHIGLSGSHYEKDFFFQYDTIYWYGRMSGNKLGEDINGKYHKLTGSALAIKYDGPANYRAIFQYQLANKPLDGSEQFFLGGMDGVRSYGYGDGYGDRGWLMTLEARRRISKDPYLEGALFVDGGGAYNARPAAGDKKADHMYGIGIGLRYEKPYDWYWRADFALKLGNRKDRGEPGDHPGRVWLQCYKMY